MNHEFKVTTFDGEVFVTHFVDGDARKVSHFGFDKEAANWWADFFTTNNATEMF